MEDNESVSMPEEVSRSPEQEDGGVEAITNDSEPSGQSEKSADEAVNSLQVTTEVSDGADCVGSAAAEAPSNNETPESLGSSSSDEDGCGQVDKCHVSSSRTEVGVSTHESIYLSDGKEKEEPKKNASPAPPKRMTMV